MGSAPGSQQQLRERYHAGSATDRGRFPELASWMHNSRHRRSHSHPGRSNKSRSPRARKAFRIRRDRGSPWHRFPARWIRRHRRMRASTLSFTPSSCNRISSLRRDQQWPLSRSGPVRNALREAADQAVGGISVARFRKLSWVIRSASCGDTAQRSASHWIASCTCHGRTGAPSICANGPSDSVSIRSRGIRAASVRPRSLRSIAGPTLNQHPTQIACSRSREVPENQ